MADYSQIEVVLRTVLTHPAFVNGSGPFTRTLHVTDTVKDIRVTRAMVEVHPEWAVERGPIEAVKHVKELCRDYDARIAEAYERRVEDVRRRLREVVEDARRLGAEFLVDELKGLPVPRRRSLRRLP